MNTEKSAVSKIIDRALAAGYTVSIHDGEEWGMTLSRNKAALLRNIMATDEEMLRFRDAHKNKVGDVMLVYGNGAEDIVQDHSDNEATAALVAGL